MEATVECISTKLNAKHKVLWETLSVKKKVTTWKLHPYAIKGTQLIPIIKLKKAQTELTRT